MYLFAHFLHIQLLLLIAVLGCCSSSSVEVSSSSTKKVDLEQYEQQHNIAAMVNSRQDDPADNIFMIGQSMKKGCKRVKCNKACPVIADGEVTKCKKRKKKMKKCCNKCHNSKCKEPKRSCDWYPTQLDGITKRRERKQLQLARSIFSEAFGDTYSFQFISRINATTNVNSIAVVDGNPKMTDNEKLCYPVNEKLCNILTVGDLFDIINIGIKNHPLADLYTYDQIVLRSVRYGQLGQPKSIVLEPLSTSISSCHPITMRTRQFRFGRG